MGEYQAWNYTRVVGVTCENASVNKVLQNLGKPSRPEGMGRPSGKALNPAAFRDIANRLPEPKTDAEIAKDAGIAAGTLSELLSGKTRASTKTAAQLALILRCDRGTLFPEFVQFGERPRPQDVAAAS